MNKLECKQWVASWRIWLVLPCLVWLVASCGGGSGEAPVDMPTATSCARAVNTSTARAADWTTPTHAKSAAPDYATVFPAASMLRMDITIDPCEWQTMLADAATVIGSPLRATRASIGPTSPVGCTGSSSSPDGEALFGTPVWVPTTVKFQGRAWNHVGMRLKGSSSLIRSWNAGLLKLPFRLDFDKFDGLYPSIDGQRFNGFEKLSFANNAIDQSFMREKVTSDLLREYGVPAVRTAWVRIYVDYGEGPRYFGVYTMSEMPAKTMLQAQFGNKDGNLYKPQGEGANWAPRSLVTTATFNQTFEKESNEGAQDWSDVAAAVDALNAGTRTTDASAWRLGLEQTFNVDKFLKWMSANAVLGNGDAYGFIAHNYYLYADALDTVPGRLNWIPWDHDRALSCGTLDVMYPSGPYPASRWPLFRYLLDDTVYRANYQQYAAAFLSSTPFENVNLQTRLDAAQALVQPFVTGADGEQLGTRFSALDSATQFNSAQSALRRVIAQRRANVPGMLPP